MVAEVCAIVAQICHMAADKFVMVPNIHHLNAKTLVAKWNFLARFPPEIYQKARKAGGNPEKDGKRPQQVP